MKREMQIKDLSDLSKVLSKGKMRFVTKSTYLFVDSPSVSAKDMMYFRRYFDRLLHLARYYGIEITPAIIVQKIGKQKVRNSKPRTLNGLLDIMGGENE